MRSLAFASRNFKELMRDPLSYVFNLGFPLLMLIVMSVVNSSIPETTFPEGVPIPEGTSMAPTVFQIVKLTPAIAVFGLTFVMLFACMRVSSDRSGAFLTRLYASPMKGVDYILGYIYPFGAVAVVQIILCFIGGDIIALATGKDAFGIGNMLLSFLTLLPSAVLFIGFGILFGSLFNDKAAPGVCSAVITAASLLGGIWMDLDQTGGIMLDICNKLPFYYCVQAPRYAMTGELDRIAIPLIISAASAAAVFALAVFVFTKKMKSDRS